MASLTDTLNPRRAASELWLWHVRAGAAALLLGGAFGAGVLLGGDDAEAGPAAAADEGASPLALADERTEKLEEVRASLRLRFHDELVGPPRDVKEHPKAARAEPPRTNEAEKPMATKGEAAGHEGAEAVAAPSDSVAEAVRQKALADQASPPERREEDESVKEEDADEDVESIAAPRDARATDQRRIAEALARVLGDDAPAWTATSAEAADGDASDDGKAAPAPTPASTKSASASARFHAQVAATPSEDGAKALVEKLRGQGLSAALVPVDLEGRGRVFRVRVGPFVDRAAAEAGIAEVRDVAGLSGFVVTE